jgi:hypothetical protein
MIMLVTLQLNTNNVDELELVSKIFNELKEEQSTLSAINFGDLDDFFEDDDTGKIPWEDLDEEHGLL